jgi:hypothetical protein
MYLCYEGEWLQKDVTIMAARTGLMGYAKRSLESEQQGLIKSKERL